MYPAHFSNETQYELYDDFFNLDTVRWSSVDDGTTGTNTANGVAGGEVSIVSAAADNDYHVMKSTAQVFKFAANKPLWFEARISCTEANTSAANWIVGLSSVTTTGFLADNGAGPASSFDGAVIYKVDGTMSIKFMSSAATVQTSQTLSTFTSAVVYQVGFHFDPNDGTTGIVKPWVYNETTGVKTDGTPQNITLSGLNVMNAIYGIKAGSASAETLKIDRIRVRGTR